MWAGCMPIHRAPHRSASVDHRQRCGPAACRSIAHRTAAATAAFAILRVSPLPQPCPRSVHLSQIIINSHFLLGLTSCFCLAETKVHPFLLKKRIGGPSAAMRARLMPIHGASHRSASVDHRQRCGPAACRSIAHLAFVAFLPSGITSVCLSSRS